MRGGRRLAGWGLALALLGLLAVGGLARGQTAGAAPSSFVVLVDMEDRDLPTLPATIATIQNFIRTGFNRRIAEGGGYTIMPFGRQVVTNRALRLNWSSARREGDAQMVDVYLRGVSPQARTRLDLAVESAVGQASGGPLTLVVFTSRSEFDAGTPHDEAIQALFDEHRFRQRRARKPMLVSLVYNRGQWGDWTVFHGDGVIEMPAWTPEPEPASREMASLPPKVAVESATPPAQAAAPLRRATPEPLVAPVLPEPNKLDRTQGFAALKPASPAASPAAAKPEPTAAPAVVAAPAASTPAAPVESPPAPVLTNAAAEVAPSIPSPAAMPPSPVAATGAAPAAVVAEERPTARLEPAKEPGPSALLPAAPPLAAPPVAAVAGSKDGRAGGWLLGLAGVGFGILAVWWRVTSRSRGRRTTLISQMMDSGGK